MADWATKPDDIRIFRPTFEFALIVERQSPADSARNMVLRVGKIRRRWNMGVL